MKYVYMLRSLTHPEKKYVGLADDFRERLDAHNEGRSQSTKAFRPWKAVVVVRFEDDQRAVEFEKYLKSGSGNAFAKRHFW